MKALKYALGAAAILAATTQIASAASLGAVEYARFTNSVTWLQVDLGGVNAMADATITHNDYNGAVTLPAGVPNNYSIHIDRTFIGDGNAATTDDWMDWYWFKIDPATMNGATESIADASLTIATGYDTGFNAAQFSLYEANADGTWTLGGPLATLYGAGNIVMGDFSPDHSYMLRVTGHLKTGAVATNIGRYDIVLGLTPLSAVPVPPALALLLTGLGALFGFGRMRRRVAA